MISDSLASVKINDIHMMGEKLVFDPFNPVNREITEAEVRTILTRFNVPTHVPITNMNMYRRAFVHKSYVKRPDVENEEKGIIIAPKPNDCIPLKTKSNDRLEFVGDGVLECITKLYLYERFPKSDEGFMTDTKIALVKNDAIGQLALDIGLHKWYIISKNAEQKNTRTNVKKLGNLFEAFLGALFLDSNKVMDERSQWLDKSQGVGFQIVQRFLLSIFETPGLVPWNTIIETNENFKNQLQVIIQKEFKTVPHYIEKGEENEGGGGGGGASLLNEGYRMGVYLCLGQPLHEAEKRREEAFHLSQFGSWKEIQERAGQNDGRIFVKMGEGYNKIKKKAEQTACKEALLICTNFY